MRDVLGRGPDVEPGFVDYGESPFSLAARAPSFLDQAAPLHVFRARYDAFWNMTRPDRAELFSPKAGYLQSPTVDAYGMPLRESRVDAQELSLYVEAQVANHVSIFADVPFRFINPVVNVNEAGLSDVSLGFKWAFILEPTRAVSAQLRGVIPTGDGRRGMGGENIALEPGLLWQEAPTDRLTLFAEGRWRFPLGQRTDFAGNIIRYGAGLSYQVAEIAHVRVMPTVEGVGWTIVGGRESAELGSTEPIIQHSYGTTILGAFYGARFTFGDDIASLGYLALSDLYVGYGHTYTVDRWYQDIFRIEYRLRF
jgi:hypothetical protein